MSDQHAIGQEVTELRLRPPSHDELGHEVQVSARVDVVCDARGDDREDIPSAFSAFIEPSKEPVFSTDN